MAMEHLTNQLVCTANHAHEKYLFVLKLGMSRWGAAVWSGDTQSTFQSLQVSIQAGLNIQMSGIGWWTTDIGGYSGGNPSDPTFRELIVVRGSLQVTPHRCPSWDTCSASTPHLPCLSPVNTVALVPIWGHLPTLSAAWRPTHGNMVAGQQFL